MTPNPANVHAARPVQQFLQLPAFPQRGVVWDEEHHTIAPDAFTSDVGADSMKVE